MRKLLLAGIASLGLVVAPAHAEDPYESGRYDVTIGNPVFGLTVNTCPDLCFGGYAFAAPGLTPTRVVVTDVSGTPVGITVGQDGPDLDNTIGGPGEATISGCGGEIDLTASEIPFDPSMRISVFVDAVSLDCEGVGTNGTIDLYVQQ